MAQNKAARRRSTTKKQTSIEALKEMTGGRGPDACIDAVGMEAHAPGLTYAYDRVKQAMMLETDRPIALREAIMSCRNGGTVSVIGVYGGFIDKFPMGSVMNRSLTIRTGQCHVQRYMKPLLERIQKGEIDPSFVITHRCRSIRPRRASRCSTTRRRLHQDRSEAADPLIRAVRAAGSIPRRPHL